MKKWQKDQIIGLAVAALLIIGSIFYTPEGIESGLWRSIILTCSFMLVLISNGLPTILLSLLCIGIMPLLKVTDTFANSFSGFSNQAVYFVMMSFGLAAVLMETSFCKRILNWMFQHIGKNVEGLILAIMICTALTSAFISDVPTCVLYLAFGESILEIYSDEQQKKRAGKAIMIAISMASMIGGIATPVGSTVNILASNILESTLGKSINFVQWMSICVPMVVIMIPVCWKFIVWIFKPSPISEQDRVKFVESFAQKEKLTGKEIRTLFIFLIMLGFWFASSWVQNISTMHVMFLGVCIMAIPGIGVTTIDKIVKEIKFDILVLIATIITLCNAMMNQGFGEWLLSFVPKIQIPMLVFIVAVMLCIYILILIVPIAPSLTMVVVPVVIMIAQQIGVNPMMMIPICSISIGCGYLLPMDSVFLMTYGKGYYSIKDFTKVSICILLTAIVLSVTVVYGIMHLWGLTQIG